MAETGLSFDMGQNFWTQDFVLGLMKTKLNIFMAMDRDETLGTLPSISTHINLTTRPHPSTWVHGNAILMQGPISTSNPFICTCGS